MCQGDAFFLGILSLASFRDHPAQRMIATRRRHAFENRNMLGSSQYPVNKETRHGLILTRFTPCSTRYSRQHHQSMS